MATMGQVPRNVFFGEFMGVNKHCPWPMNHGPRNFGTFQELHKSSAFRPYSQLYSK